MNLKYVVKDLSLYKTVRQVLKNYIIKQLGNLFG